ncbi:unnamed protein product [Effrenium voratum]|nr:unnamed protein product [Effrenium voratum]
MATGGLESSPTARQSLLTVLPDVGCRIVFTLNARNMEGKVGFAGDTEFAPGKWIGVILDTADGKNDGSVKDKQYFTCKPQHGLFVRPQNIVQVLDPNGKPLLRRKSLSRSRSSLSSSGKKEALPEESPLASSPSPAFSWKEPLEEANRQKAAQEQQLQEMSAQLKAMQNTKDECGRGMQEAMLASEEATRRSKELAEQLELSKQAAASARQRSDDLAESLRRAEDALKAKSEELRHTEEERNRLSSRAVPEAEVASLRQELQAEQRLQQSKSEEISRLETVLQQEKQICASLQQDWRAAQSLAEEARGELLKASKAQMDQAKELEAMSLAASQKQCELVREIQELRDELTEARRRSAKERHAKSENALSPVSGRSSFASFTDFFMSQMCCSRNHSQTTLVPADDDCTPAHGIRLDGNPGSGEAPTRGR